MRQKLTDAELTAYILGELTEEEQISLENEIFADEELFQKVQALKEQLLDDYANNRLSAQQREPFERQFLNSPWRRDRVVFAQALADHIKASTKAAKKITAATHAQTASNRSSESDQSRSGVTNWRDSLFSLFSFIGLGWRNAIAVSLLLLLAISAGGLLIDNLRLRSQLARLKQNEEPPPSSDRSLAEQLAQELERNRQLEAQLNNRPTTTPQPIAPIDNNNQNGDKPPIFSFILNTNTLRGEGGRQTFALPKQIKELEMIVRVAGVDKRVQALIASLEGELIWQSLVNVQGAGKNRTVRIRLKSITLPEGDYVMKLSRIDDSGEAIEDIGEYPFRVINKL